MAPWVKTVAANSGIMDLIPVMNHIGARQERIPTSCSLTPMCAPTHKIGKYVLSLRDEQNIMSLQGTHE